ncbi:MAG: YbaB/EbfC family nucleoid-associated protein [Hamadaea sp.]|uniref:YbaB/EbfC family nucleoid-associated protein n=1 Tax=Hamadaea sp. TaxID=2024425 RepID=UPI00182904D1|nr:YbaB/EbfC family nucleoid-associated protein [Hamadaea sp.]NUT20413.1 YbaB/EbfC family nucleoid-associated protein [Hamadaea sp.]
MAADREMVESLRSRAELLRGQVERATSSFSSVLTQLRTIEVTAVSADRLVTVVVGADGKLRSLRLDPGIYHQPDSVELANTIEETIRVAADAAQKRMIELCEPLLPPELAGRPELAGSPEQLLESITGGFADILRKG